MAIRKSVKPVYITNSQGDPEIVLEIGGLTLSMTPPPSVATPSSAAAPPADPAPPVSTGPAGDDGGDA